MALPRRRCRRKKILRRQGGCPVSPLRSPLPLMLMRPCLRWMAAGLAAVPACRTSTTASRRNPRRHLPLSPLPPPLPPPPLPAAAAPGMRTGRGPKPRCRRLLLQLRWLPGAPHPGMGTAAAGLPPLPPLLLRLPRCRCATRIRQPPRALSLPSTRPRAVWAGGSSGAAPQPGSQAPQRCSRRRRVPRARAQTRVSTADTASPGCSMGEKKPSCNIYWAAEFFFQFNGGPMSRQWHAHRA